MQMTAKSFIKSSLPQILLLLSSAFWGASFVFTNGLFLTEPHITTMEIVTGRLLVATLFFLPILAITRRFQPLGRKDVLFFLLLSFLEPFLYFILETSGVKLLPPSISSIVISTIPLFVPFAMSLVYKEKLSLWAVLGVLLSLVGVAIMLGPSDLIHGMVFTATTTRGLLCLLGAVSVGVVYVLVLSKVIKDYRPITITAYQNAFSLIYFIPLMFILDADTLPLLSFSWGMWYRLIFLGVFCSTIAYVCYNYGILAIGATAATVYNNVIPVFTLILALLMGQETFTWGKIIGMLIVIAGLFLAGRSTNH